MNIKDFNSHAWSTGRTGGRVFFLTPPPSNFSRGRHVKDVKKSKIEVIGKFLAPNPVSIARTTIFMILRCLWFFWLVKIFWMSPTPPTHTHFQKRCASFLLNQAPRFKKPFWVRLILQIVLSAPNRSCTQGLEAIKLFILVLQLSTKQLFLSKQRSFLKGVVKKFHLNKI